MGGKEETNKRKALAIAKEIWVNQKAKKLRPQTLGTMTISQAIDEYLYYKDTLNETDRYHLERIRKELGEKPIGLLTKKDLKNLQQKYKKVTKENRKKQKVCQHRKVRR